MGISNCTATPCLFPGSLSTRVTAPRNSWLSEPGSLAYGYVTKTRIFGTKMPFCGTKYTLFREALSVGKISSNSSRVGSDGRTRIMRGIFVRVFLRRSWSEGRIIELKDRAKAQRYLPFYRHQYTGKLTRTVSSNLRAHRRIFISGRTFSLAL